MNPKLLLCSTKPCVICSSWPDSFSIILLLTPVLSHEILLLSCNKSSASLSQSLSISCSLYLETPVHVLCPFSLHQRARPSQTASLTYCILTYRRRQWHSTPVLLPGKSHGWKSLEGCSPWGCWGSDTTEWLHFHFSLSCIGKGNGNPLQCSCLESPRDGGAWWASVSGVAQSRARLKWLSSSSSSILTYMFTLSSFPSKM